MSRRQTATVVAALILAAALGIGVGRRIAGVDNDTSSSTTIAAAASLPPGVVTVPAASPTFVLPTSFPLTSNTTTAASSAASGSTAATDASPPVMPTEASVGPRVALTKTMDASQIQNGHQYSGVHVTGSQVFTIPRGDPVSFTDCVIDVKLLTYASLNLSYCKVLGGVYPFDVGGSIDHTLIDTANTQAFRPAVSTYPAHKFDVATPYTVTNSIFRISAGKKPDHVEATFVLGGSGLVFRNTVFYTGGPPNETQTADLNVDAANVLVEDCWFTGFGSYSLYVNGPNNLVVRPHFGNNQQYGYVYPSSPTPATIVDPMKLDGTRIALGK